MERIIDFGVAVFISMVVIGSSAYFYTWFHEKAHERICEEYGANHIEMEVNLFEKSYVLCDAEGDEEMHVLNEIVGYHVGVVLIALFLMFGTWTVILMTRGE